MSLIFQFACDIPTNGNDLQNQTDEVDSSSNICDLPQVLGYIGSNSVHFYRCCVMPVTCITTVLLAMRILVWINTYIPLLNIVKSNPTIDLTSQLNCMDDFSNY
jgi:hypothetical protein